MVLQAPASGCLITHREPTVAVHASSVHWCSTYVFERVGHIDIYIPHITLYVLPLQG